MPFIYKPKAKRRNNDSPERQSRQEIYNTLRWRELRAYKLALTPFCQLCDAEGKITMATQVHHKDSPFNYIDENERVSKAYDLYNLESICAECHGRLHQREGRTKG